MLVSVGAYALLGGWWFGLGLVGLIFVHEMGHVLALRRQGVPASAPLFIPFMGAVIGMKRMPANAWREAEVALAGPLLGSLGAAAVWAIGGCDALALPGRARVHRLLPQPLQPDPGRPARRRTRGRGAPPGDLAARARRARWRSRSCAPSPILPFILIIGGLELWRRWRSRHSPSFATYYRLAAWQRGTVAVAYLGLAALLVLAMSATHVSGTTF